MGEQTGVYELRFMKAARLSVLGEAKFGKHGKVRPVVQNKAEGRCRAERKATRGGPPVDALGLGRSTWEGGFR